jgi:hypothetical protein
MFPEPLTKDRAGEPDCDTAVVMEKNGYSR